VREQDSDVADVLGIGGIYRDPLWRVTVELTSLERELLRSATWRPCCCRTRHRPLPMPSRR